MEQRPPLNYRGRSNAHRELAESNRKAIRCFVYAALLTALGIIVFLLALAIGAGYHGGVTSYRSRSRARLAACTMVGSFLIFGAAIKMFDAAFYHRSGFEHRHKDR